MSPVKTKPKNSTNQSLFMAIGLFVVLLALAVVRVKAPQLAGGMDTATMIFSFDGSKERVFNGPVMSNMTVLEAVLASAQADDIKVTYYVDSKNDVHVSSINNDLNLKDHTWNFYLNHVLIKTEDINKIYVKTRDLIEAKYQ